MASCWPRATRSAASSSRRRRCRPARLPRSSADRTSCGSSVAEAGNDGPSLVRRRHLVQCRQELDGHRDLRVAPSARRLGRAVQGAEHVQPLVSLPRRRRDWARAGGAGGSLWPRAGAGDEPDPPEACRRRQQPGGRQRPRVEDDVGAGVLRAREHAADGRCSTPTRPCQRLRRHRHRRRRKRQRAQSPGARPRQSMARHRDSGAVAARCRHRARRRVRIGRRARCSCSRRTSARSFGASPSTSSVATGRFSTTECGCWRRETGSPCLGVYPYLEGVHLDAEDSLAVETGSTSPAPPGARTAIIRFPRLSNATDFRLLTWADWLTSPPTSSYDFVILPGSKNTLLDLAWLRETGLADWVVSRASAGRDHPWNMWRLPDARPTDCGPAWHGSRRGQPMGLDCCQSRRRSPSGSGRARLPLARRAESSLAATRFMSGSRRRRDPARCVPFATLEDGSADGAVVPGVLGTYLHGALEHPGVCAEIFGIDAPVAASKAHEYERLADWFEGYGRHLDELIR